jgi:AGZA family xanthine/uracil permease-like MFS transporter
MFDRFFRISERGSTVRREAIAGVTTFMTMAYIIFVNPSLLSSPAGAAMDFDAVMVATCLASAFATILMGALANYPIALAPGMGLNVLFSFGICGAMGVPWPQALGMVFWAGVIFTLLTFLKVREMIVDAVPDCLKFGAAAGIGAFIAFMGLKDAGIIAADEATFVTLGHIHDRPTLLALGGLFFTAGLMVRRVRGGILWGILATGAAGVLADVVQFEGVVSVAPSIAPVFGKLDIAGALRVEYLEPIFVLLFFTMFDTIGTLIGVGEQAGLMVNGRLPGVSKALFSDAMGSTVGSAMGTSTVTSYVESAAGVAEGGRTGMANMVTAGLFIVAIFFAPVARMFGGGCAAPGAEGVLLHPVTAPALIIVGSLMAKIMVRIDWEDYCQALPAFLTIIVMPLTHSISNGLAIGFITYPTVKLLAGRGREVHVLIYVLAILLILRYIFLSGD